MAKLARQYLRERRRSKCPPWHEPWTRQKIKRWKASFKKRLRAIDEIIKQDLKIYGKA